MPKGPGWSAERALDALVDALDEGVLLFDAGGRCRAAGRRAGELFGVDPAAARGLPRAELLGRLAAAAEDPGAFLAAVEGASAGPQLLDLARPERRQVVWTTAPVLDGGARAGTLDIVREVTRERTAERRAEEMARALAEATTVDPVTGLMNRRRFAQDLDREHRRAQRAWDSYALARIDVDGMRALNDELGTAAGDALLRRLGEELRISRREYDLVGRWDSDEFIVCLPGVDGKAAKVVVERALLAMRDRAREAIGRPATMSAGIAVWIPPSGDGPEDMIRRAGDAVSAAREQAPSAIVVDLGAASWKGDMGDGTPSSSKA